MHLEKEYNLKEKNDKLFFEYIKQNIYPDHDWILREPQNPKEFIKTRIDNNGNFLYNIDLIHVVGFKHDDMISIYTNVSFMFISFWNGEKKYHSKFRSYDLYCDNDKSLYNGEECILYRRESDVNLIYKIG